MKAKYFTESELSCPCCGQTNIDDFFVHWLDDVREECGFPLMINSGYRCPEHNEKIGSKVNSAHVKGLAVDISCTSSDKRFKIIEAAIRNGCTRIGIGKSFIHLDISEELPQEVFWLYGD